MSFIISERLYGAGLSKREGEHLLPMRPIRYLTLMRYSVYGVSYGDTDIWQCNLPVQSSHAIWLHCLTSNSTVSVVDTSFIEDNLCTIPTEILPRMSSNTTSIFDFQSCFNLAEKFAAELRLQLNMSMDE